MRHHRFEQIDHHRNARDIAGRIGRKVGTTRRADRIIDMASVVIQRRAEHFRAKIDAPQRCGKMELRRRQQLNAESGVVGRIELVQRLEINCVIAQVEFAIIAGLPFQFDCAVEISGPDVERAVPVHDLHRVVDHLAVGEAHADLFYRKFGERVEPELFHAPFGTIRMSEREDIGARGISRRRIGSEHPAAIILLDSVIEDHRAAIHDLRKIGCSLTIL